MKKDFTRLHITPFNPDLLPVILGPTLLASATNISFNSIQTFPESNYGYLDLPVMDAEKVKKRVNGAILKGKKIKVEAARPSKRRRIEEPDGETLPTKGVTEDRRHKRSKKEKNERNVIAGHELPADRKVKRGWTEANQSKSNKPKKGESKVPASKYSDKDELLFRTKLPENRSEGGGQGKERGKTKERKDAHVVHEFASSTKQPSFLRQEVGLGIKGNLEYIEGQGWVNEVGETIEQESHRVLRQRETTITTSRPKPPASKISRHSPNPSSSSGDDNDSTSQDSHGSRAEAVQPTKIVDDDDETSSSGSSSDPGSDGSDDASENENDDDDEGEKGDPVENEVHPLEALFKKPKKPTSEDIAKPSLEVSTSFSFFDPQEEEEEADEEPRVPGTPFSSQDIRARGLRSAAPTPDTAYPSRFNSYGSTGLPGDEADEEDGDLGKSHGSKGRDSTKPPTATPSRNQSEFEKKFWENRGENNRAWKQRRRTVLKEKRQRENKARRPKDW